ncbi:MAG TPA: gamma-glutamylcyclotransferase [Verrucomicrobiales bacterium]|nr:gamma-glutamylcyclotransferase [Verrucomicrobiales bacterium]HIL71947.1 gamma-glutamylcyclotransferase [Verrucomicrobiota bacterium]
MFDYFGYGSNMDSVAIRAKGVDPVTSQRGMIKGWKLGFNVAHFFRHEGGVANIVRTGNPDDCVHGVVHRCEDEDLVKLDTAEAFGFGYDRIEVTVKTESDDRKAIAYVGLPDFIDDRCRPSQRYLNILVNGAKGVALDQDYIQALERTGVHNKCDYPEYIFPDFPEVTFTGRELSARPDLTALAGAVFDMSNAREAHDYVRKWFGGRDMTLFHLKRMDSSNGKETIEDIKGGRLSSAQRSYLNEYLNEYAAEYAFAGRFLYD